jgi:hydrogenase 3 maturation protease
MPAAGGLEGLLEGATRLAVLGVGSELRSDDAAGMLAAERLERAFPRRADFLVAKGGSAPENLTGPIAEFGPSHLVVVDCADLGLAPGSVRTMRVAGLGGLSASTHSLPLRIVVDYLVARCRCEVVMVGIQPGRLDFDGKPTIAARAAAARVARSVARAVRAMERRARGAAGRADPPGGGR